MTLATAPGLPPRADAAGSSPVAPPETSRRRRKGHRDEAVGAWILSAPYLVLLLVAGVVPVIYAVVKSLQNPFGGWGGLSAFQTIFNDFRFVDAFLNIAKVMVVWLPIMMIGIVGLALLVHASPGRFGSFMRFTYYIPGALAGIANFVLWVYLVNPSQSPLKFGWDAVGVATIKEVVSPANLPLLLAGMLFFQGVGTWIVIVNGGLNGISEETLEAARLDGANAWTLAWRIKLPLIRPWLGYAGLMNLAYGFQLFLEPQLLDQVAGNSLPDQYTPNQLGFAFAFSNFNFPAAAAMSLVLLVITLAIGLLIVFKSGLFGEEHH